MFLPNGNGGILTVWNWEADHVPVATLAMPSEPRSVDYSPDGKRIAVVCATSEVALIDTNNWSITQTLQLSSARIMHNRYLNNGRVRFSPDGNAIIVWGTGGDARHAGGTDNQVYVFDVPGGELRHVLTTKGRCCDAQFSPDGTLLATATFQNQVRVWKLATGQPAAAAIGHPDWVFTAKFSPDGQYLVTAGRDSFARVWHWSSGQLVANPMQHDNEVMDVAFLNGGKWIATASHDSSVRIWHAATGRPLSPPLSLADMVWQLQVSPDERHILVGGKLDGVFSIDLQHIQPLRELTPDSSVMLAELASGKRLIGDGGITNLTVQQYMDRWQAFRQAYPDFLDGRNDPAARTAWHRRSMLALCAENHWEAALWHADRLVQEGSGWPSDVRQRAVIHQQLGNHDQAVADYSQLVNSTQTAIDGLKGRAALYLEKRSWNLAVKDYQQLTKLAPNDPRSQAALGVALELSGRIDEAIAAIRRSVDLDHDDVHARVHLAGVLARHGASSEAVAELRKALDIDPHFASAYLELTRVYLDLDDFENAASICTQALQIELPPSERIQLQFLHGMLMEQMGRFEEALASKEEAYALGARHPAYKENPEQWLEEARRQVALNAQLDEVLDGSLKPESDLEKIAYAEICYHRKRYADHVRLAQQVFEDSPHLAGDMDNGYRYNAACSASLAGGGRGDGKDLDESRLTALREQAIEWLQQELAALAEQLERDAAEQRSNVASTMRHWQRDPDLAAIRDPSRIERLSAAQRSALHDLWNRVETLRAAAEAAPASKPLKGE